MTQNIAKISKKINCSINFPPSLICKINPSLRNKYKVIKQPTKLQRILPNRAAKDVHQKRNDLIIHCKDTSIMSEIDQVSRFIHHHTIVCLNNTVYDEKFLTFSKT